MNNIGFASKGRCQTASRHASRGFAKTWSLRHCELSEDEDFQEPAWTLQPCLRATDGPENKSFMKKLIKNSHKKVYRYHIMTYVFSPQIH